MPEPYRRQDFQSTGEWKVAFRREFDRLVKSGAEFSSEDVRGAVGLPPEGHWNRFGAVFRHSVNLHRENLRIVGLKRSAYIASHGRYLPVYRTV